jgi:predicted MFS family arabinose efflux permease
LTRIGVSFLLVVAASEAVFATTHRFPLAIVCMTIIGFATVTTSITCQTLLQNTIDGHVRGRVMSLYGMAMRAGPAVGALALGVLSERVGLQWTVLGSAFCCALAWVWAQARMKRWATVLERTPT